MGWFENRSTKEKKSLIKNLIVVMLQDGEMHEDEMNFLATVNAKLGLTEKQFKKIIDNPKSVKFIRPKNQEACFEQIVHVVYMMMVDGKIDAREMKFCMGLAVLFGFDPSIIQDVVEEISTNVKEYLKPNQLSTQIKHPLSNIKMKTAA